MDILDQGYNLEQTVFSIGECDKWLEALRAEAGRGKAGTRHLMSNPMVRDLARDQRLLRIARGALGGSAVPFQATLFAKSHDANWLIPWHQDTALPLASRFEDPEWVSWALKAGVHYAHARRGRFRKWLRFAFIWVNRPAKTGRCASCHAPTSAAYLQTRK